MTTTRKKLNNPKPVMLYLEEEQIKQAKKIGNGNMSQGVRISIRQAVERLTELKVWKGKD